MIRIRSSTLTRFPNDPICPRRSTGSAGRGDRQRGEYSGSDGQGAGTAFQIALPGELPGDYAAACKAGTVRVGSMFVTANPELSGPHWIINFPTKQHWKQPSKLDWIESGLVDLRVVILKEKIRSIAIPRLGCGLGGLDWTLVRPRIVAILESLPEVDGVVYEAP